MGKVDPTFAADLGETLSCLRVSLCCDQLIAAQTHSWLKPGSDGSKHLCWPKRFPEHGIVQGSRSNNAGTDDKHMCLLESTFIRV